MASTPTGTDPRSGRIPHQEQRGGPPSGHEHRRGHSHDHGADLRRAGERHRGRLLAALVVLVIFTVVELVGALVTGSLALLSDAGHMITDVMGIAMALAAITLASRPDRSRHRTFGLYRLEILAALANAVLLFGVAGYILFEAVGRLATPHEIPTGPVLVVAGAGLVANLVAFALLREGSKESLNVEGAYLEVVADTLGSVAVIAAALVIALTGWTWVDPLAAVGIGAFVLPRVWRLGRRAVRILVQAAPDHLDLDQVEEALGAIGGVVDVHDLHVWTLTSEMEVASAHLRVADGTDTHAVLDRARALLEDRFGIEHATIQVEPLDHEGCDRVGW